MSKTKRKHATKAALHTTVEKQKRRAVMDADERRTRRQLLRQATGVAR